MWDRSGHGFLVGKLERQNGLKGLGVERGQYRNESKRKTNGSGSGWGPIADSCEHGNNFVSSTKCMEYLDKLRNH
jgi:hypothetical protein